MKKRYTEEQIIKAIKQHEAGLRLRASLEELKYPARRGIRPEQLTQLLQGHHLNYGQNALITGAIGCDKAYLACVLGE